MKFMLGVVKEIREEIEGKLPKGSKLALIVNGDMNTEPHLPSLLIFFNPKELGVTWELEDVTKEEIGERGLPN